MNIYDHYNACVLVRTALSAFAKEGDNRNNYPLMNVLSHLWDELDKIQPEMIDIEELAELIATHDHDPWFDAGTSRTMLGRGIMTGCPYQTRFVEDPAYDLDLSDEALHPDE
jgi:hypothetical protein